MTSWLAHYGIVAVLVLMFIDAVFPAASELVMVYGGALASGALVHRFDVFGWHATGFAAYIAVVIAGGVWLAHAERRNVTMPKQPLPASEPL